jgi:hypothetical protein
LARASDCSVLFSVRLQVVFELFEAQQHGGRADDFSARPPVLECFGFA